MVRRIYLSIGFVFILVLFSYDFTFALNKIEVKSISYDVSYEELSVELLSNHNEELKFSSNAIFELKLLDSNGLRQICKTDISGVGNSGFSVAPWQLFNTKFYLKASACDISVQKADSKILFIIDEIGVATNGEYFRIPDTSLNAGCTDTDGGRNIYIAGEAQERNSEGLVISTVKDGCADYDNKIISEAYCENGKIKVDWTVECPGSGGCRDGACIRDSSVPDLNCVDSDGGRDYYVKGFTSNVDKSEEDFCKEDGKLIEYSCNSYGNILRKPVECKEGEVCFDGACRKESDVPKVPVVGCTDLDGDGFGENCAKGADCNDNNKDINSGKNEICSNSIDENCNGRTDEGCEQTAILEEAKEEGTPCDGCKLDKECISVGTRVEVNGVSSYCNVNGVFSVQLSYGDSCQNDFECKTNKCIEGACFDAELERKIEEDKGVDAKAGFFERLIAWFYNLFKKT